MERPESTYMQDFHRHLWLQRGIEIAFENFRTTRDGDPVAEITVRSQRPGQEGHLHGPVKMFFLSSNAITGTVKALRGRLDDHGEDDLDWPAMVEQARVLSLRRAREGGEVVRLGDIDPEHGPRFLLAPFIEGKGDTILFGDGGTGKSVLAAAVAVSVASGCPLLGMEPAVVGPVLYLDWESDAGIHAERMRALCAGFDPEMDWRAVDVLYRREVGPLSASARDLQKIVQRHDTALVIVDSIGLAGHGPSEEMETKRQLFSAMRSLGVPILGIDHIGKARGTDRSKPFGSVYTHNSARLAWRADQVGSADASSIVVKLINTKANHGRAAQSMSLELRFGNEPNGHVSMIEIKQRSNDSLPAATAKKATQADQIEAILHEANDVLTSAEITERLASRGMPISEAQVRSVLSRHKDDRWVKFGDGWLIAETVTVDG